MIKTDGRAQATAVTVRDLEFAYGESDFRLRVPLLTAAPGEKVALIGPSGSGKTTLLHLLAGIRTPLRGEVLLDGQSVSSATPAARRRLRLTRMGLVFQEFELLEYLNVLDNVLIATRLTPLLPLNAARRQDAVELARQVGLEDKLLRYPDKLSQGEKQRVAICRALLIHPPLLLADEPTGNLDPVNKRKIMQLLVQYAADRQTTLIAATHDYQLLEAFDRVVPIGIGTGTESHAGDADDAGE
jgi:putative ABC transport system ATP-binding protein